MTALERLQGLLRELFQYDFADLDFGIYRLLRLKRQEVDAFLTEQLSRRVDEVFAGAAAHERASLDGDIAALRERIRAEIADDALLPTGDLKPDHREQKARVARDLVEQYEAARGRLRDIEITESQKADVFNHLYGFFSRYYEAGDFVPRHRYGAREAYAVPYSGEEVLLHWANRGQHYVKSAETFRDYSFTVDTVAGSCRVRFVIAEASVPPGDTKGDTRYFFPIPAAANWDESSRTFRLPFHYRLPTEKEVERHGRNSRFQEAVLQVAEPKVLQAVPDTALRASLGHAVDHKDEQSISLLLRRLRHFCRRNTSDYFIHRDLDGFLRRELEFYLKDQVLHLADLDADLSSKQRTLRVVRDLAGEIITFLAQIEEAQRRLFEKRKFVLRVDYLVPIAHVPRELWKQVLANKAQIQAWHELFAIEPKRDLFNKTGKVNEDFLQGHATLVVDTRHFPAEFKDTVLAAFEDVDEATDGLLIHSENYQALRLLQPKYRDSVRCIYIDPPYNTGSDEFIYKVYSPKSTARHFSEDHDYILVYARKGECWKAGLLPRTEEANARYDNPDNDHRGPWKPSDLSARNYYSRGLYTVTSPAGRQFTPPKGRYWSVSPERFKELDQDGRIWWGPTGDQMPALKRFLSEVRPGLVPETIWPYKEVGHTQEAKQELMRVVRFARTEDVLNTVKPTRLVRRILSVGSDVIGSDVVLDFFAGSGTTADAVIRQNREDGGSRRFILVEMGRYFDDIILQRVCRSMYAPEWKDCEPKRLPTKQEVERTPRLVKMLRLESYDDALHNLSTEPTLQREAPLAAAHKAQLGDDEYRLSCLVRLPLEASASVLNLAALEHPLDYKIEVLTEDGPTTETVDLVETFNFLYGLHVQRVETWTSSDDSRRYRVVKARKRDGARVLVLWRDMKDLNPAVERRFVEEKLQADGAWDEVLINGDSAIPAARSLDGLFKRLMEEPDQ